MAIRRLSGLGVALLAGLAALGGAGLSGCGVADPAPRAQPVRTMTVTGDPAAARAEVTFVVECDPDSRVRRPTTFVLACADGNELLERLTWRAWGESQAHASGDLITNDCNPDCARGKDVRIPVRVVADQLVEEESVATYRRLTVTADDRGDGVAMQEVYHLPGVAPPEGDAGGTGPATGAEPTPAPSS